MDWITRPLFGLLLAAHRDRGCCSRRRLSFAVVIVADQRSPAALEWHRMVGAAAQLIASKSAINAGTVGARRTPLAGDAVMALVALASFWLLGAVAACVLAPQRGTTSAVAGGGRALSRLAGAGAGGAARIPAARRTDRSSGCS